MDYLQRWRCGGCRQEGIGSVYLAEHIMHVHVAEREHGRIKCVCGLPYADLYTYVKHYTDEHTMSLYECSACEQGFISYVACWLHARGCNQPGQ